MKTLKYFLLLLTLNSFAKVDPPNFSFKLDELALFMPGKNKKPIEKKYGAGKAKTIGAKTKVTQYFLKNKRYRFPIFVQYYQNKVADFYVSLPSYFSHDVFHAAIIKRFGKQDIYRKVEEQALYIWKKKTKNEHFYSGGCSITCFPIYYSVQSKNLNQIGLDSIRNQLTQELNKTLNP